MPDPIRSPQEALPVPISDNASCPGSVAPTIAGGSAILSTLDADLTDNALIFTEIERLLTTACAMAQYYERGSIRDAIVLALRINRMDYEGRRLELTGCAEPS